MNHFCVGIGTRIVDGATSELFDLLGLRDFDIIPNLDHNNFNKILDKSDLDNFTGIKIDNLVLDTIKYTLNGFDAIADDDVRSRSDSIADEFTENQTSRLLNGIMDIMDGSLPISTLEQYLLLSGVLK